MKTIITVLATILAIFPSVESIRLNARRDAPPRVLSIGIQRQKVDNPIATSQARFRKRQTVSQELDNILGQFYFANISVGTPGQRSQVVLDTGSSDLWINSPNSELCTQSPRACRASGTYDGARSSTNNIVNSRFNISYADGSGAAGDYVTDTLAIGGQTLENFQFGVGDQSTSSQGVLGIGYSSNEVAVQVAGDRPYNNLPLALVEAGLIQTPAYSLWLNDLDASTGEILFGGVDVDKYDGDLSTLPIQPERDGSFREFQIALTGVAYRPNDGDTTTFSSGLPVSTLLDSGSTLSYLPDQVVSDIYDALGAQFTSQGLAITSCNTGGFLDFTFSEPTIAVDVQSELLFEAADRAGNPLTFDDGSAVCIVGILPNNGGPFTVLGDTFLRSAYVVYDMANNEISLAQTTFNSTSTNIQEIARGSQTVPGARVVENPVTSVPAQAGGARGPNGGIPTDIGGLPDGSSRNAAAQVYPRPTGQAQVAMGYLVAGAAIVAAAAL